MYLQRTTSPLCAILSTSTRNIFTNVVSAIHIATWSARKISPEYKLYMGVNGPYKIRNNDRPKGLGQKNREDTFDQQYQIQNLTFRV